MRGGSRITITPAILSPSPGTYTPTPTPPSVRPPPKEFPPHLPRNNLHMHKVTIPPRLQFSSSYCLHVASLKSVTGENSPIMGRPAQVRPTLQSLQRCRSLILLLELNIHIPNHVVSKIITNVKTQSPQTS